MAARLIAPARTPAEFPEPEMAVSDERAHAARLGERQRPIVGKAGVAGPAPGRLTPGFRRLQPSRIERLTQRRSTPV